MISALQPHLERWRQLQPREQWMLGVGAVAVVLTLLYLLVWEPVQLAAQRAEQQLQAERATAQELERAAALVGAAGPQNRRSSGNASLLTIVDRSLKGSKIGKPASRIQPDGDSRVRVWLEDVSFDALLAWLADLEQHQGVRVGTADIDKTSGQGLVDVRLSLERGA